MPDTMNEMERTPYSTTESLRVRCPHCRKLYLVQFTDIQESKPRFECVQCHSRFWLSLPDMDLSGEIFGIPENVKEAPSRPKTIDKNATPKREMEPCPKCFKLNEHGAKECQHCGVVIDKYKATHDFTEPMPMHSRTLEHIWKKVIADYGNESLHADFMRACNKERNLAYAGAVYSQMQKLMPTDETTTKRLREIQALGSIMLPTSDNRKSSSRLYPRLWQVPLIGASLLIVVGLVLPVARNMVGVGAAFLFIAIAINFQLRSRD